MRHYEIVFLVHPDQSEQVPAWLSAMKGSLQNMRVLSIVKKIGVVDTCLSNQRSPQSALHFDEY